MTTRGTMARAAARWIGAGLLVFLGAAAAPAAAQDWKQDWDRTVAAAKKEGEIIISAPSGRVWRDALNLEWKKSFPEIELKMTPAASREFWPRIVKEQEVGQFLWDLRVGGPDNLSYNLKKQGYIQPVRDLLVLPDVIGDEKWYGGMDGLFLDKEKKNFLGFVMHDQTIANYNRKFVSNPEGLAFTDLTDGKWKGKISMADPRGGSPLTGASVLLKAYGEDFVRKLYRDQEPVVSKEPRLQMQWMVSGRYPVAFGIPTAAWVEYEARGVPIDDFVKIKGTYSWSQGVGGIQYVKGAPHPNASKVFINWILKDEVQRPLMQAAQLNSRRIGVPSGDPEGAIETDKLDQYVGGQTEEMRDYQDRMATIFNEILQ
jgi:iron(III) transport system substrate-binding protein